MSFQMKTHTQLSSLFVSVLLLTACASTPTDSKMSLSPERIASLLAANDNIVVPGERVGAVFLGMTDQQLYKKLGEPTKAMTSPGTVAYMYPTLLVDVDPVTHKVWEINTTNGRYSTAEGITIGSSSLAVHTQLVGSYILRSLGGDKTLNDYANGLTVMLDSNGDVFGLTVWIPGHAHF